MIYIGYFRGSTFISESIGKLLTDEPDFKIIFETTQTGDLWYKLTKNGIHILIVVCSEEIDQLKDMMRVIRKQRKNLPVIYIQTTDDIAKAHEIEKMGVTVLIDRMSAIDVIGMIRKSARAFTEKSDPVSGHSQKQYQLSRDNRINPFSLLNKREQEIIYLLSKKLSRKEIAGSLSISVNTVDTYLQRSKKKCNCQSPKKLLAICEDGLSNYKFTMANVRTGT